MQSGFFARGSSNENAEAGRKVIIQQPYLEAALFAVNIHLNGKFVHDSSLLLYTTW